MNSRMKDLRKWEEMKRRDTLREQIAIDAVWELYEWNLLVLKKRKDTWQNSSDPEDKLRLIAKGDVDALLKFYTQIKDKSIEWKTYVKVVRELMAYISESNLRLAQELNASNLTNEFLAEKKK